MAFTHERSEVVFGQSVSDGDGNELGRVRNLDDGGFHVATEPGVWTPEQAQSKAGEKTHVWRCDECGEVGGIDDVPSICPACDASGKSISDLLED